MKKKYIASIIFAVMIIIVFGACSLDESNYDAYTDTEFARELLVDSWEPLIEFINTQGNDSFSSVEFQNKMVKYSSDYSSYILTYIAVEQDDGKYVIKKEIWIPSILDEEVTIASVEIKDENDELILIIEEKGQFVDRNYGLQRKSIYIMCEDGEFYQHDTTGSFGVLPLD